MQVFRLQVRQLSLASCRGCLTCASGHHSKHQVLVQGSPTAPKALNSEGMNCKVGFAAFLAASTRFS